MARSDGSTLRRTRSRFFDKAKAREPATLASVAAFTAWRLGLATIRQMRSAQFEIEASPQYFAVLREYLVFLIQVADRLALARLALPERRQFTVSMAKRLAELLAENQSRLLGEDEAALRRAFIDLFNRRGDDYAPLDFGEGEGECVAFMRLASVALLDAVAPQDRAWVADQVMSYEAPGAVRTLRKVLDDLVGTAGAIVTPPDEDDVFPADEPMPPE